MRGRSRGSAIKLAFLIFLAGTAHAQDAGPPSAAAPLRVLFIGNSLTYTNDLPQLVARLSQQSPTGRTIEAAEVTYPSWRLSRHWESDKTLSTIRSDHWDFVVLQPGRDAVVDPKLLHNVVELFDAEIRKVGARTILYVQFPWLRYVQLQEAYEDQEQIASAVGVLSAPVGPAWKLAVEAGISPLALYDQDFVHPSLVGTYLAACVFFSVITGTSPEGLRPPWGQGAGAPDTAVLNSAAWRAIQKVPRVPGPAASAALR